MNHQTADHTANASVFLFFTYAHFLKTILASRTNGTFAFAPTHRANPFAKSKEPFLAGSHFFSTFEVIININLDASEHY